MRSVVTNDFIEMQIAIHETAGMHGYDENAFLYTEAGAKSSSA